MPAFQIKASLFPTTILEIASEQLSELDALLEQKVAEAPLLFDKTPVMLEFCQLEYSEHFNFDRLLSLLKKYSLLPIGYRTQAAVIHQFAQQAGLVPLQGRQIKSPTQEQKKQSLQPFKQIEGTVRSGQRILSETHLVLFGSVNQGAEVFSAGDIHIYGSLRGKAFAGIYGNQQAQIVCQRLEPELVAIAGHYKISETIQAEAVWKSDARIFLEADQLSARALYRSEAL